MGEELAERTFYIYEEGELPTDSVLVNHVSGLPVSRTTYDYDEEGRIGTIAVDGSPGAPDGYADTVSTFTYDASGDVRTRATDKDGDGNPEVTTTYTWSAGSSTVTTSKDSGMGDPATSTIVLGVAPASPNDFLMPNVLPLLLRPQTITTDDDGDGQPDLTVTFVYDGDRLLRRDTKDSSGMAIEHVEYGYTCE